MPCRFADYPATQAPAAGEGVAASARPASASQPPRKQYWTVSEHEEFLRLLAEHGRGMCAAAGRFACTQLRAAHSSSQQQQPTSARACARTGVHLALQHYRLSQDSCRDAPQDCSTSEWARPSVLPGTSQWQEPEADERSLSPPGAEPQLTSWQPCQILTSGVHAAQLHSSCLWTLTDAGSALLLGLQNLGLAELGSAASRPQQCCQR